MTEEDVDFECEDGREEPVREECCKKYDYKKSGYHMVPNRVDSTGHVGTLVERSILEVVEEVGDSNISGDDLTARAKARYAELTKPFTMSQEDYMAETISGTFIEVAERLILGGGKKEFDADVLVETVIDGSVATFERALGAPEDEAKVRAAIRQYIDDVHCLPQ